MQNLLIEHFRQIINLSQRPDNLAHVKVHYSSLRLPLKQSVGFVQTRSKLRAETHCWIRKGMKKENKGAIEKRGVKSEVVKESVQ